MKTNIPDYGTDSIAYIKALVDKWGRLERQRKGVPEGAGYVDPDIIFENVNRISLAKTKGIWGIIKNRPLITVASLLVITIVTAGAAVTLRTLLAKAAYYQQQLKSLRNVVGIDRAFDVVFETEQPDIFKLAATVDPALVSKIEVTYDDGQTWRQLFTAIPGRYVYAGTELQLSEDSKTIAKPGIVTAVSMSPIRA